MALLWGDESALKTGRAGLLETMRASINTTWR